MAESEKTSESCEEVSDVNNWESFGHPKQGFKLVSLQMTTDK